MHEDRLLYLVRNKTPEERLLNIIKKPEVKKDSTTLPELVKKPKAERAKKTRSNKVNILAIIGILSIVILCLIISLTVIILRKPVKVTLAPVSVQSSDNQQMTYIPVLQKSTKSDIVNEILNTYAFTGTILGEKPEIIIEDKRYSKTYYLKESESLGDIKILKIKRGLVTLQYQGEKLDIQI